MLARVALTVGACLAALAWHVIEPGVAEARGAVAHTPGWGGRPMAAEGRAPQAPSVAGSVRGQDARERPTSPGGPLPPEPGWRERPPVTQGRPPREPGWRERPPMTEGQPSREPGWRERPPAAGGRSPGGTNLTQPGQLTPEKIERWRRMSPEERERIRERYRRWKALPPERRERLLERSRRWRELPEGERRFLVERREMYRTAWPEQKRVIEKFFVRWRQLPPDRRLALKRQFAEWRGLPAAERDEQMMGWPFYNRLRPDEQRVIRWFLFSEPAPPRPPHE